MVPIGLVVGFLGGLLIEIGIGLVARAMFSAENPAPFSMRFLGSLPGLGALCGALLAPILYARHRRTPGLDPPLATAVTGATGPPG